MAFLKKMLIFVGKNSIHYLRINLFYDRRRTERYVSLWGNDQSAV